MLKTIDYLQIVTILISLLLVCSFVFALVIEAAKKLIGDEKIKEKFGSLEFFSLIVSFILGAIVYLAYLLFFVVGVMSVNTIDIVRLVFIGVIFVVSGGLGSQVGYDKVIKVFKNIFHIN